MKACLFDLACHGGRGGAIAVAAMLVCGSSYAQSSVTLYGVIDTGITYVNNQQQSVAGGVAGKQA